MPFPDFIGSLFGETDNVNTNTFGQNQALLTRFLQNAENATIRVFAASGPGMGHQANTVNIMWSLIAAGFNQSVQLIYDDAPTVPTTIQKLAILIPGLDAANPVPVTISGVTISFIASSAFDPTVQPLRNFGITGGYDIKDTNLATTTNTSLFLKLQPYCWPQPNVLYIRDAAGKVIDLSGVVALGGFVFTRLDYYLPLPQMSEADYVSFTASNPTKVDPYKAILASCAGDNPLANMMPIYGIGDKDGKIESLSDALPESILFNLIASVAYTQEYSDVGKLKKGAIIVVVATVSAPCYVNLATMLNGATTLGFFNEYVKSQNLAERVNVISYDDPGFAGFIDAVRTDPKKILVIKMNGLPAKPFNYIYYKSTLPCVFEGKGTASLVLNLPVPFFYLTSSLSNIGTVYPTLPLQNKQLAKAPAIVPTAQAKYCNTVAFGLVQTSATTNSKLESDPLKFESTSIYAAGQFIWKVNEAEHPAKTYLQSLPAFFHVAENDKLLKALFYMLQCTKDL